MALQTSVNVLQGFGVAGEFFDDSPRRVNSFIVAGGSPVVAASATGTITFTDVPTADDTVTIGGQTYTFVASPSAAYDVDIHTTEEGQAANLAAAINAGAGAGTVYGTDTVANLSVTAEADGAVVTVTAIYAGAVGNTILLAESADNTAVSGAALTGGADAASGSAKIGYAFTVDPSNKAQALVGSSGTWAGIAVNPKEQSHSGLAATMEIESGKPAGICTFGHIIVNPVNAAVVGYSAYYETATGAIYAYSGTGSQSGKTLIVGSKFILVDADAGKPAVLELN